MPMLSWMGRERAVKQDKEALLKILREDKSMGYLSHAEKRRGGDGVSENLRDSATPRDNIILVHGDNLEALKALLPFYAGEVKCIYIDPPYNTGSAFELYNTSMPRYRVLNQAV